MTRQNRPSSFGISSIVSLLAAAAASVLIVGNVAAQGVEVDLDQSIEPPTVLGTAVDVNVVEAAPVITGYDNLIADLLVRHDPARSVTGYDAMIADLNSDYLREIAADWFVTPAGADSNVDRGQLHSEYLREISTDW